MVEIKEFIKPEMLVIIPALYFIGMWLKKSAFVDKYIPLALGGIGVILAAMWVLGTSTLGSMQAIFLAFFTAIVQGVLCAGLSVYVDQLFKQAKKGE